MEQDRSPRPRAVSIIGWIWLVAAALRFLNALLGLLVWKVGGMDRLAFLRFQAEGVRIRIAGMETFVKHADAILGAQIVVAGAVVWLAVELLRMKPWARPAMQAVAGAGILLTVGIAVYVYSATANMAGAEGEKADQVRIAGLAAAALITVLGSAFFGITIWVLSRPAVRRAFAKPA